MTHTAAPLIRTDDFLDGEQALYLEQLYTQYQTDATQLTPEWQQYFQALEQTIPNPGVPQVALAHAQLTDLQTWQAKVSRFIRDYRTLGHLAAKINPLGDYEYQVPVPELELGFYQLDQLDPDTLFDPGLLKLNTRPTLRNILQALQDTYTRSLGFEFMHIMNLEERVWLQNRIEPNRAQDQLSPAQKLQILDYLTAAEGFEQYLHRRYVGQKRFGLEGGESLIPLLQTLIQDGGTQGLQEIVIGMAHRGRLNVLINVLAKPSAELFKEFEGKVNESNYTSDVKYHKGYSANVQTAGGVLHLALAFNPSHLEIVSPVVEGSVRARQDRREDKDGSQVLSVIIHGDAAFAGQGVVMETFNMAQTRGYRTRGTVHIVINNQIGFTTSTVNDSRSTYYPTDVAKMINAPIIHVNGDDPEAVVYATRVALEYRQKFQKDVVLDLVCYRRLGHNEADEPTMTQPVMYDIIRQLPSTRTQYAQRLIKAGLLSPAQADEKVKAYRSRLDAGEVVGFNVTEQGLPLELQTHWRLYLGAHWREMVNTAYPAARLQVMAERSLSQIPADFVVHPRVLKVLEARLDMAKGERLADWGFGETMAYASLLEEGFDVRLSGQDSGRGTFSHRHAVLHHQRQRRQWTPLKYIAEHQANFTVIDSVLSEEAVLAFEYGYATAEPETLVIWEAQFGDFVNGAQVVIDQFISSGEQKWQRLCGLVLFLPHGFEGQGPEHSSARIERFAQLAAQDNMQICIPTTPAQTFHMLRRQMLRKYRKPLIVFTPKSLLRHPLAMNPLSDFSQGSFQLVIDDIDSVTPADKTQVTRLVICSGKVYYDLLEERRKQDLNQVAIIRLEQVYPFPASELLAIANQYPNLATVVWCQEEPRNQGLWNNIRHRFEACQTHKINCVSRPAMAAPAVGSLYVHQQQQQALVHEALGITPT